MIRHLIYPVTLTFAAIILASGLLITEWKLGEYSLGPPGFIVLVTLICVSLIAVWFVARKGFMAKLPESQIKFRMNTWAVLFYFYLVILVIILAAWCRPMWSVT